MPLSEESRNSILLDIHQDIDECADQTVDSILNADLDSLTYPPNVSLSADEISALKKFERSENLRNALKKIIADNSAAVVFNFLNNIDGTTEPKNISENWNGVKLIDADQDVNEDSDSMLHDEFYTTYWSYLETKDGQ